MDEASTSAAPARPAQRWYRRRKLRRILVVTGLILASLGLVFSYAPRYIARHLIASQLDRLGIEHEGIDTLRINPWKLEAWIGPVSFRAGQAQGGRLAEIGVDIRFGQLFTKHVLIGRLLVRGMDLRLTRDEDGHLYLDGVPLEQFFPEGQTAPAEEPGWGAGLDGFEMRESRLVFDDRGGELVAEIDRLTLDGFRTWSPEQPGKYELEARVNDINIAWSGDATPFADNIRVRAKSRIEGADLPKIARYTGTPGLDRSEGIYDTELDHDLTVFASGRIEGSSTGTIRVLGADYARSNAFALKVDHADLGVDTRFSLSEALDLALDGTVSVELTTAAMQFTNEMQFELSSGELTVTELAAQLGADRSLRLAGKPEVEVNEGKFTGRLKISVNQILQLLAYLQSLSAGKPLSTDATGLDDWSEGEVVLPKSDVTVAKLSSAFTKFEFVSAQGTVDLDLAGNTELSQIQIDSGDRTITTHTLRSKLDDLTLRSGQGQLSLHLSGVNSLADGSSRGPIGELKLASATSAVGDFQMQSRQGLLDLRLQGTSDAKAISGVVYEDAGLPETGFSVGSVSSTLDSGSTEISPTAIKWAASGSAEITDVSASVAKGQKAAVNIQRMEVTKASADQSLSLAADRALVGGLNLSLSRSFLESFVKSPGSASKDKGSVPADAELVREIQRLLGELGFDPGAADGIPGRKTRKAIRAFQKRQGLEVNGEASAPLLAELKAAAAGEPTVSKSKAVELPKIELDRFALVDGATVRFLDDTTDPQVKIATVFEKAEIRNLDTVDSTKRTELQVSASVNEFSRIKVDGWASALGLKPDFDVTASIADLQLPTFSPYAVGLAGMYLQSGQLSTTTNAVAQDGALSGQMALDMLDVEFQPLSDEDAKRLADHTGGMPISTVVALLQDSEGRIELNLPLRGSVTDPDVDISSAITKAIGGAFKSVFRVFRGKGGGGLGFEPIVFAAGSAELTAEGRAYADGLVELLSERPKLSLDVCGQATAQDLQALLGSETKADSEKGPPAGTPRPGDERAETDKPVASDALVLKLMELANERTQAVRRYLITDRGIAPARIAECRASVDPEDSGPPRAEVSL